MPSLQHSSESVFCEGGWYRRAACHLLRVETVMVALSCCRRLRFGVTKQYHVRPPSPKQRALHACQHSFAFRTATDVSGLHACRSAVTSNTSCRGRVHDVVPVVAAEPALSPRLAAVVTVAKVAEKFKGGWLCRASLARAYSLLLSICKDPNRPSCTCRHEIICRTKLTFEFPSKLSDCTPPTFRILVCTVVSAPSGETGWISWVKSNAVR